ncbi:MAG: type IV pilus secretin PilQ [Candidatus Zixiibacteriota bacterium]|nr:MAG: type IV pilus secretin PilQ [candidate division Zixibacteria bacterium]
MKRILQRRRWLRWCTLVLGISLPLVMLISVPWGVGEPGPSGKKISALNFQNASMQSVLSFLADYGDVNIVSSPAVDISVTLSLQDVTWRQALDILLKTYSLTGVEENGYIRVLPTPEFLQEQALLEKRRAEQVSMVPLATAVIPVKHGTAGDMLKSIKQVVSARGTIDTDERTNSVVIRDTPEHIEKVKHLVETLDKETHQIKISTQLLEIESGSLTELGVDWSMASRKSAQLLEGDKSEGSFSQTTNRVSDPAGTYTFAMVQGDFDIEGAISALVSSNKGKIIAHPEITTVDNREAFIQMGQKVPIKQFDEAGNVVIQFEEVGTILRVTPHITSENRILLRLKPERSSYTVDAVGVIINTNNAETNVVVDNGQTTVIGGLTTQMETESRTGLPFLKDIPLLGYLFRYTRKEIADRDLVIFVTPTIVTDEMQSLGSIDQPGEGLGHD